MNQSDLSNVMFLTNTDVINERSEYCHVCLRKSKLTKEHIPPKSAFNDCTALWDRLFTPTSANKSASRVQILGGFWVKTLCRSCNNNICSPYANEYVKFVRQLVESPQLFEGWGKKKIISLQCDTLMISKQIAAMILAIQPIQFAKHFPELREFVINPVARFKPAFEVYGFLVPDITEAGTISRMHGRVDTFAPGFGMIGGEISHFPFGFVFAHDLGERYDHSTLSNITHWFYSSNPLSTVSLVSRLTGIDSIKCGAGAKRIRPQVDYV